MKSRFTDEEKYEYALIGQKESNKKAAELAGVCTHTISAWKSRFNLNNEHSERSKDRKREDIQFQHQYQKGKQHIARHFAANAELNYLTSK